MQVTINLLCKISTISSQEVLDSIFFKRNKLETKVEILANLTNFVSIFED